MSGSTAPRVVPPSGQFYIFGSPGAISSLPTGTAAFGIGVLARSFVRSADMLVLNVTVYDYPAHNGFVTFDFPPQHIVESTQNAPAPVAPQHNARVDVWGYDYLDTPPGAFLWPAPIANKPSFFQTWWGDVNFTQGTRLCFYLPDGADTMLAAVEAGNVAALLDWSGWSLCLSPWGLSNASFQQAQLQAAASIPGSQAEAEVASTLAMIFGLVLTPTNTGGWTHLDQPAPLRGRTELWHTRLVATQPTVNPTLRAIWSLPQAVMAADALPPEQSYLMLPLWDAIQGSQVTGDPTNAFEPDTALTTGSLDQSQGSDLRIQLINATSALGSGRAVELPATDVLLSAMGGSLTTGSSAGVTFRHRQVLGRDIDDGAEVTGRLLPFGHSVLIATHRIRSVDGNGFASLTHWTTVRVLDPVVRVPVYGMRQPFSTVTLLTTIIPPIYTDLSDPPAVLLEYLGTDYAGRGIRLQAWLAFQLNGVAPAVQSVMVNQQVVTYAAALAAPGLRAPGLRPADIPGAAGTATSLVTDRLMVLPNALGSFAVASAQVRQAAVAQFRTDAAAASAVALLVTPPAIPAGFTPDTVDTLAVIQGSVDSLGNEVGVPSVTAAAQGGLAGLDTSRFGAFAAPQLAPAYLSKTFGAAGSTLDPLMTAAQGGAGQLQQVAKQAIADLLGQTKLFGLFTLSDLLGSALQQAQQTADQLQGWVADNSPKLAEIMDQTSKTVTLTLDATPPADGGLFTTTVPPLGFLTVTFTASTIRFSSTVTTSLADPSRSVTTAQGTIGAPTMMLALSDGQSGVSISLTELTFTSASNAKPSFSTGFNSFAFTGDLSFLNGIMSALPSSLFSNPPQLTIDDSHAEISCSVGLPAFGFGVFDFRNIGLMADAVIRFDPSSAAVDGDPDDAPLAFGFDFGTPDSPFSCAVSLLEGQGSFGLMATPSGIVIDCSMAFGGAFAIDLAVVSGSISATAGLHLTKTPQDFDVAGFVHISGGVEVLDIIGVTLDAMLSLSYSIANREFTGSVQVTLGISVLWFHQDVSFGLTESFSLDSPLSSLARHGAAAPLDAPASPFAPRPSPVLAYANVWDDYCAGFAA